MNTFIKVIKKALNESITDNGAKAFKTTFEPLLNCNYGVVAARLFYDESCIEDDFKRALKNNKEFAIAWLFYLRDCRGGIGERDTFRKIITDVLSNDYPEDTCKILELIPEYGRWDDLVYIFDKTDDEDVKKTCIKIIRDQIMQDMFYVLENKKEKVSLCAKWLPSPNTSSNETRRVANKLYKHISPSISGYRKALSLLRKAINVTERNLSSKTYDNIDYSKVPSRAALKYTDTFIQNDGVRFSHYVEECIKGNATINTIGISPYEILRKACEDTSSVESHKIYELMWDQLVEHGFPNIEKFNKALCVVDSSGSMSNAKVSGNTTAFDVASSLGLYFSTKMTGPFHDKMITFASKPAWIDVSKYNHLKDKYELLKRAHWSLTTNIEAVFDLILKLAKGENVKAEDMPDTLLIVSDMQFNGAIERTDLPLMKYIKNKFHEAGYKLPKLVFWNVAGNAGTIPAIEEEDNGVALISGFNQNAAKVATSDKKDPYLALVETITSDRYIPVIKALK